MRRCPAWALALAALSAPARADVAGPDAPVRASAALPSATQSVVVVGTTILTGTGLPLEQVPANVQLLGGDALASRRAAHLGTALEQGATGISLADTAGNPFQQDLNFRGFTASPALGTPQGLSVFIDGVRVNEAFGDTVNWDLLPAAAIDRVALMPGSNPVFGLNTLGGALAVTTRDGFAEDDSRLQASGGAWGRRSLAYEGGGHGPTRAWFAAAQAFDQRGWGRHDPSRIGQLFAKASWRDRPLDPDDSASASLSLASTRLSGSQTLPLSMLSDPRQSYTWPDTQGNRLAFVTLMARHRIADGWLLEGNAFVRQLATHSVNSNVSDSFDTTQAIGPGNEPTGNLWLQIGQRRIGATLQLSARQPLWGRDNHFAAGASKDSGFTGLTQATQEAGASRDTHSSAPLETTTALHARNVATGIYAFDTLALDAQTFVTMSARWDRAEVRLADQLGSALDGHHRFQRLDPALGITVNPTTALTGYASYNEGMRAPTPVELSCADPAAPCSLPNAFVSDPALAPVVSRTIEFGLRGHDSAGLHWSAALWRTTLSDDIQFISSGGGASSAGYFRNVGQTRRTGLELSAETRLAPLTLSARYSITDARFETPMILASPNNSSAAPLSCETCAEILVRRGDRMPLVPRQLLRLRLDVATGDRGAFGASLLAQSSQVARGDENNRDRNGPVPGFALVNVDGRLGLAGDWELFFSIDNLLDRRSAGFGTLGRNEFTAPGGGFDATGAGWRSEQFRTAGAPRAAWVGIAWRFGGTPGA